MVGAKRGARTIDTKCGIVYALEHRFRGPRWQVYMNSAALRD